MPAGQGIGTDCAGSLSAIFPVFSYLILIFQTGIQDPLGHILRGLPVGGIDPLLCSAEADLELRPGRAGAHHLARSPSLDFWLNSKFGKRRNTVCTRKGYAASVSQLTLATAAQYFSFFKLKKWGKKTAAARRHNCAVLPYIKSV